MSGRNLMRGESLPAEYWVIEMGIREPFNDQNRMILTRIEARHGEPRIYTWKAKAETVDNDAWIFDTEADANTAARHWHKGCEVKYRDRVFTTAEALEEIGISHPTFMKIVKEMEITGAGSGIGSGKLYRGRDIARIRREWRGRWKK